MKNLITTILFLIITSFAIAQGSLDSGLVAYYPFSGNANDESGNGNNGSLMNGVSFENDRWNNPNQAIRFNKSLSQYVDVQNSPSLQIDSAISFSFWTKRNILDNGQDQVLNKGGDWPSGTCNYGLVFSEWTLCFIYNGGYYIVASPGVPLDYNWHHYAVTALEGTTEIHFYVDGVEKTAFFGGGDPVINLYSASSSNLHIGGVNYYSNNSTDDLKIYNCILSGHEIKLLYSTLVAYYPFNGNANDETGNGYNGAISGATLTTDRFNQTDKAYNFDYNGFSSDRIQISGTSNLNFSTGGFSISAWINFSGTAGSGNNYPIVSKHICGEQSGYILMLYNGKLTFWLAGASGYNILSTNEDYTDETWHHVVAVYDGSNKYIYVDGVLKNSVAFSYSVFNSADWALGGYNGCNGGFNGKVDEVKIYSRSLSAAEVFDDYNSTKNSLVAYLPFNGNTIDVSGNGHDGTVNGNATLVADRFNSPDRAFTFPNQSSNISLANSVNMNLQTGFTLNAWVKYKDTYSVIIGKHVCGYVNGLILGIDYDGQFKLWLGNASWQTVNTSATLVENRWYMLTATYDGSSGVAKIYLDGELENSANINYTNFNSYPISIGEVFQNNCNPANMSGAVDEVKIYNRALSDAEILEQYNLSNTDLVAYWAFDGNTDDSTSNNNDGINYNGVFSKDRYGNDNTSIFFNAVDSYVEGINPGNNLPVGNSPRTFSAWIRNNQYNQYGCNIFHYGTAQPAPTNFHFLITDVLGLGNGYGYGVVYGNTNLNDSTWHFVTGVYEGGSERITKLYVDGKIEVTGAIATEPNTVLSNNWRMGRFMEGSSNFNGNIDELKVYDIPLTDQQVWDRYKATTTAPNLLSPGNDSTLINPQSITLDWDSTVTANEYHLIIASDSLFSTIIKDTITNTSSVDLEYDFFIYHNNQYWKVRTINNGGIGPWSEINHFSFLFTDVEDETQLPIEFALMQNYPNPFNPSTSIQYAIAIRQFVQLKVYDVLGNEIAILVNEEKPAGNYEVQFQSSVGSHQLASGIYYYQLKAGEYIQTKKLIIMK